MRTLWLIGVCAALSGLIWLAACGVPQDRYDEMQNQAREWQSKFESQEQLLVNALEAEKQFRARWDEVRSSLYGKLALAEIDIEKGRYELARGKLAAIRRRSADPSLLDLVDKLRARIPGELTPEPAPEPEG